VNDDESRDETRNEVRHDLVAALTRIDLTRATPAQAELLYNASDAERELAARHLAEDAVTMLREAGVLTRRTVLDLRYRQFVALAAAYETLRRWWLPTDERRTLGDLLKIIPADEAEVVVDRLVWGRLLERPDGGPATDGPSTDDARRF
jgi:hypothetical protein